MKNVINFYEEKTLGTLSAVYSGFGVGIPRH